MISLAGIFYIILNNAFTLPPLQLFCIAYIRTLARRGAYISLSTCCRWATCQVRLYEIGTVPVLKVQQHSSLFLIPDW
jgi:hypothetical protein